MSAGQRRLLLVSILPIAAAMAAPARADGRADKAFEAWVNALVKRTGSTLCRIGVAQYDARQAPVYFATLTMKAEHDYTKPVVVFAWGKNRHAFSSEPEPFAPDCGHAEKPPAWERGKEVVRS
jgi:hypothetical protein